MANAWKAFFASCWLWKHFPCKNLSRCLKKWESAGRSQVRQSFIAQFIQLLKCWLCDLRALSWRRIRPILLTNAGYRHCSFWCISSICWVFFSDEMTIFLICGQLMRHLLIKLFHFSNLLPMPDDQRMVHVEFFDNFSYSCKRISFDDPPNWSLSSSNGHLLDSQLQGSRLLCKTSWTISGLCIC